MGVDVVAEVTGERLERAWQLYADVFDELRFAAVQRHVMFRAEFDEVMADHRVNKYLALRQDRLVGLSTFTNDLSAVPLISPQYFERRWPEHYAQRRIWYCLFAAVRTGDGAAGVFPNLVEAMYRTAAVGRGLVALDVCRHNEETHRMSRVFRLMLHRLSGGVEARRLDEQSYWLYEFPAT